MQALHQENVSFCSLRRYFTQINKWDAVYIWPQFGLKISGGGASVWFENKRGGWGGWVGGGPLSLSPGSATALAFYYEPVFLLCITILLGTKICA